MERRRVAHVSRCGALALTLALAACAGPSGVPVGSELTAPGTLPAPTATAPTAVAPSPTPSAPTGSQPETTTAPAPTVTRDGPPGLNAEWSQGKCAPSGAERFSAGPMRVEDIGAIVPMGLMVDSHVTPVDHIYFEPLVFRSTPYQYGVFAPADGWVVSVGVRNNHVSEAGGVLEVPQYRMVIEYSCHLYTIYDLITRLAPEIEAQMGTNPGYTVMRVPVRAGQEVGRIGGQTLDMNVVDLDVQVGGFAAPEHYVREPWKIHSVDPFDYFVEPLRSQLLALNPRQASPRGGRIGYDVPGRLVGNWFAEGTNGYAGADPTRYWAGHLSIVYDLYDPSQVRVSIGTFEGRSRQFGVRGNGPDPALVDASSGLVVYELVEWEYLVAGTIERWDRLSPQPSGIAAQNGEQVAGVLLAQVQADGTLLVEALPGVSAAQVSGFSSAAQRYER